MGGPGFQLATAVCWIDVLHLTSFPLAMLYRLVSESPRTKAQAQGLVLAESPVPCVRPSRAETVICTLVRLYSLASGAVSVCSAD